MYLLYADESGAVADPSQPYFVLAGVAVFERATHWIQRDLDQIAARFNPDVPQSVELHGSPMRGGRDMWRSYPFAHRLEAIKDALRLGVDGAGRPACTLFAVVIRKSALSGVDPVEFAFVKLSSQFDLFLRRRYLKTRTSSGVSSSSTRLPPSPAYKAWRGSSRAARWARRTTQTCRCFWTRARVE